VAARGYDLEEAVKVVWPSVALLDDPKGRPQAWQSSDAAVPMGWC